MTFSTQQLDRLAADWSLTAQQPVRLEVIRDVIYAYGTELAVLRLLKVYRLVKRAHAGFSENLGAWYFSLQVDPTHPVLDPVESGSGR